MDDEKIVQLYTGTGMSGRSRPRRKNTGATAPRSPEISSGTGKMQMSVSTTPI